MENTKDVKFYFAKALDFTKGEAVFRGELDEFTLKDKTKDVIIYERENEYFDYLFEKKAFVGANRLEAKQEDFYTSNASLFILRNTLEEVSKEAIATKLLFQTKSRINTEKMFNELTLLEAKTEEFKESYKNSMIDYANEFSEEIKRR